MYRYFKRVSNTDDQMLWWKSKGCCNENIKPPTTSDNVRAPALSFYGTNTRFAFRESCLK